MNLFILDTDPIEAARQNCDKHVCKIILEAADMCCLAHWETGGLPSSAPSELRTPRTIVDKLGRRRVIYKYRAQTQANNHVSIWVRTTRQNYLWTVEHGLALCDEYERRYGDNLKKRGEKAHAARSVLEWFGQNPPRLPTSGLTEFRQAVAREPFDCLRPGDPVEAYRQYYVRYKAAFAKWKLGNTPQWFMNMREALEAAV